LIASTARPRVREEDLVEPAREGGDQPLRQDPGEQRHVHLHQARQLALEHLRKRRDDAGWFRPSANTP
jgi:hypothetical protein